MANGTRRLIGLLDQARDGEGQMPKQVILSGVPSPAQLAALEQALMKDGVGPLLVIVDPMALTVGMPEDYQMNGDVLFCHRDSLLNIADRCPAFLICGSGFDVIGLKDLFTQEVTKVECKILGSRAPIFEGGA